MKRRRGAGDDGVTLVEILVSIVIIGVAVVAILAAFQLAIKTSDINRKQTTGGAYVRSYAESLQRYLRAVPTAWGSGCFGSNTFDLTDIPSGYRPAAFPAGYVANQISATPLTAFDDPTRSSCDLDTAVRVRLQVSAPDARATETLDLVLQRPCAGTLCTGGNDDDDDDDGDD